MSIFDVNISSNFPSKFHSIVFGMGCFWGAEKKFWHLNGLYTTVVGYAGGVDETPSYEKVCTGTTGHAEVVKIVYDQKKLALNKLLKVFWESHDPTQINRQGNDIGTQYRSVIYVNNKTELNFCIDSRNVFQEALDNKRMGIIQTEIKIHDLFFNAEEYHQKYLFKNPNGYCGIGGLGIKCDL